MANAESVRILQALEELIKDWRERARLVRPLESATVTAEKRARIAEWIHYTNRANELGALITGTQPATQPATDSVLASRERENQALRDAAAERDSIRDLLDAHEIDAVGTYAKVEAVLSEFARLLQALEGLRMELFTGAMAALMLSNYTSAEQSVTHAINEIDQALASSARVPRDPQEKEKKEQDKT